MKYTLFFVINTACDIACKYCFYTTGHEVRDGKRFNMNLLEPFIYRLSMLGFQTVILSGGDPLNRSSKYNTYTLIKALKAANIRVIINTSGAYLNADDCAMLIECNPDRIDFSIDSHVEQIHNSMRGRFEDTIRTIHYLIAHGYTSIVTTTVITTENMDTLDETLAYLSSIGIKDRRIQPAFIPHVSGAKYPSYLRPTISNNLRNTLDKFATVSEDPVNARRYHRLWERYFGDPMLEHDLLDGAKPFCQMGKNIFVADSQGDIVGCFHRSDIKIGNLFCDPIEQLSNRLVNNKLRQHDLPPCAGPHCVSLFDGKANWKAAGNGKYEV